MSKKNSQDVPTIPISPLSEVNYAYKFFKPAKKSDNCKQVMNTNSFVQYVDYMLTSFFYFSQKHNYGDNCFCQIKAKTKVTIQRFRI